MLHVRNCFFKLQVLNINSQRVKDAPSSCAYCNQKTCFPLKTTHTHSRTHTQSITRTNSTSHKWRVHRTVLGPADWAYGRRSTGPTLESPCAHRWGTAARRRAARAWRPVYTFPARPPAVSWPWPSCFGTRFSPESPSGWASWRTRLARRWRGTVSGETCAPAPAAGR